jgi:hypothetical protein
VIFDSFIFHHFLLSFRVNRMLSSMHIHNKLYSDQFALIPDRRYKGQKSA